MASVEVRIVEGIDERYVDDALRVAYDAFAKKFRIGFRNADDLIRLFRDSVDRTSCLSATVDGRFAGILTFQTAGRAVLPYGYDGGIDEILSAEGRPRAAQSPPAR